MEKKVLVLAGSSRKRGNTDCLADEFIRGAQENGCAVEKIYLKDKDIRDCLGCCACRKNGGTCVQKDDMPEIYEKIRKADAIVFASPVYFYTWNSLMKRTLDRMIAIEADITNKTFYLLSAGQAPEEKYMQTMIDSYHQFIGCFRAGGNQDGGYIFGLGTDRPGDVKGTAAMERSYRMGKTV